MSAQLLQTYMLGDLYMLIGLTAYETAGMCNCCCLQACTSYMPSCLLVVHCQMICRKAKRSDGLDCYCKACNCKQAAERQHSKRCLVVPASTSRLCHRCGQEKPTDDFVSPKSRLEGMQTCCRYTSLLAHDVCLLLLTIE